jgi:drug/metabolite transporter (DMT)-like permease
VAKVKLASLDPIGLATAQLSLATLMIFPVALLGPHPVHIQTSALIANITLGVAGSGLAYLLYYSLLDRISSTRVVSVTYLLPIWGLFWGSIAHEHIAAPAYIGVAIVILGLYLLNRKAAKPSFSQVHADDSSLEASSLPVPATISCSE